MEQLLNQLDLNLKELYRKALDADAILDELQNKGQAKQSPGSSPKPRQTSSAGSGFFPARCASIICTAP